MASIYKAGKRWYLSYYFNHRNLKKRLLCETEEQAREALAQFQKGPDRPIELTPTEVMYIYRRSQERAKERGIKHMLSQSEVHYLYVRCGGLCEITGIPFNRFRPLHSTKRPWYPSLDRIDSRKPYTRENCRFVCVAVNIAMGEWGDWVLTAMAKAIVLGSPGIICHGDEAAPYSFPALTAVPTKRQERRRARRTKADTETLTTHEPTDAIPLS